jgi:hypothetical protein
MKKHLNLLEQELQFFHIYGLVKLFSHYFETMNSFSCATNHGYNVMINLSFDNFATLLDFNISKL